MKIKKLMNPNVVTVEMEYSVGYIKGVFDERNFHHLAVLEDNKLVGIISDRDLFKVLSPNIDRPSATTKDMLCLKKKAHQIMSHHPLFVREDDMVKKAVEIFTQNDISCLPVLNSEDRVTGMLSWRDIMSALMKAAEMNH